MVPFCVIVTQVLSLINLRSFIGFIIMGDIFQQLKDEHISVIRNWLDTLENDLNLWYFKKLFNSCFAL